MNGVNASTAIATTATAEEQDPAHRGQPGSASGAPRIGRFAPSPTGPLHTGSVLAALGSWLDARHHDGRWLLRMEDIDTPRVVPGAADAILRTLETLGLTWDGPVQYQSRDQDAYLAALLRLRDGGLAFDCSCSRRELTPAETGYPGTCRNGPRRPGPHAVRFRVSPGRISLDDLIQGRKHWWLEQLGDVVIRRRDGLFAYQLAVVVDDARQGITHVVRGADLLDSTPWQIALQYALGLPRPQYAHLPVLTGPDGGKLAKSRHAIAADITRPGTVLVQALTLLRQDPPPELLSLPPAQILSWARQNWNPLTVQGVTSLPASTLPD